MDNFGIWGVIPPVLTILLAFLTKDVIVSLFLGIMSGALITGGGNLLLGFFRATDLVAGSLADGWNIRIFLFCALLGGLVGMLTKTGAASSFGKWATVGLMRLNHEKKTSDASVGTWAQFMTFVFGVIIFIDDYFNSLSVGTVMRPICDKTKTPRAKLAYILDSTAAPICIIAPISSWVVTVMSTLRGAPGFDKLGITEMTFFVHAIPYNLYALTTIIMVLLVIFTKRDFGPMKDSVALAAAGTLFNEEKYGAVSGKIDNEETDRKRNSRPFDMLFPIITLIASAVLFFPITTYIDAIDGQKIKTFGEAVASMGLGEAFNNTDSSKALCYSIIITIFCTYVYYIARRLLTLKESSEALTNGIMSMVPALIILAMAWSIGTIIKSPRSDGGLGLGQFLSEAVRGGSFPIGILPAILFVLSAVIAFATGTSWGTFAIMIPIGLPIVLTLAAERGLVGGTLLNAAFISMGAIIGGAVFGDHASPISDTTILSSTGAGCPHLEHVATQLPYAFFVATCSIVGLVVGGMTLSPVAAWLTDLAMLAAGLVVLPRFSK